MSETANPFSAMFELQRRSIEQQRAAFHRSVDVGTQAWRIALNGMDSGRTIQHQSNEAVHAALTASLDAMASMPGGEASVRPMRELLDRQFDAVDEVNDQTWDALGEMMAENADAVEAFAERYLELVDDSSEAALGALGRTESSMSGAAE